MRPGDFINTAFRFRKTVSYLSFSQILTRGRRVLNRKWSRVIRKRAPQPSQVEVLPTEPLFRGLHELSEYSESIEALRAHSLRAADIRSLKFEFLNHPVEIRDQVPWHDCGLSHLWRYHLHYFDYCQDLLVDFHLREDTEDYQVFKFLAQSWIDANSRVFGDGWHPYTLSVRIVNWVAILNGFEGPLASDPTFRAQLLSSIRGQLEKLSRDLEHDVRGNHLIKNLRALIIGGGMFGDPRAQKWQGLALRLLKVEVEEQILPDGGHFERNPGYHLVVFKDLLECAVWLHRNRDIRYSWLDDSLRRMMAWTIAVSQPENRMPLLKDTTIDSQLCIADLLAAGAAYLESPAFKYFESFGLYPFLLLGKGGQRVFNSWKTQSHFQGSIALKDSGFYLLRDSRAQDLLIFDAGRVCPDYLPAHAHADLFSYELTCGGTKVVVDSGVYEYSAGPWRDYFRSTRAHNTVELNKCNQSDVWGSFRVAARAFPKEVFWNNHDEYIMVQAEHDGYMRPPHRAVHHRSVFWQKGCYWLIFDRVVGEVQNEAVSHIHFHPDIEVNENDRAVWQLQNTAEPLWMCAFGHSREQFFSGAATPRLQGWYSESFSRMVTNTVLSLHAKGGTDLLWGYIISKRNPAKVLSVTPHGSCIEVTTAYEGDEFIHRFSYETGGEV